MTTATRTLIQTDTPGWFIDPDSPDKKTRKSPGDTIVSRAEYEKMLEAPKRGDRTDAAQTDEREPVTTTALSTGKVVTGQTVEIRCAWVDPDKRTDEQKAIFDGDPKEITYDAVKAAANGKRSAFPDGTVRRIKPQDAFQVRFCPDNQTKWRAELRRRKAKARREAARAAAAQN